MSKAQLTVAKVLPYILIVAGVLGLLASMVLTVDKIALLKDPGYTPSCSISPLLSCVSVIGSWQASALFGIPNPLFGIAGFSMVLVVGVAMLAQAQLRRWFWLTCNVGLLAAIVFVHWLISQSIYVIGALCLWCMLVWVVTAAAFWYTTLYNLQQGHLSLPGNWKRVTNFVFAYHDILLCSWYVLILFLILQRFWSYFSLLFAIR